MTRRDVIPHFTLAQAKLVERLLSVYEDSQGENWAVGMRGKAEEKLAHRARKAVRVAIQLAKPPRRIG